MKISVIICTHNPKPEYLNRTLSGIRNQTLQYSDWELIIVDNASELCVKKHFDISWHPNGKIISEEKLGLTHARLKGISEASGDLFIFFDDDNVPEPDYLEISLKIAYEYPYIGAFGGNLVGEFEIEPKPYLKEYLGMLAIRTVERNTWSNLYIWDTTPAGAGVVIRAFIAKKYTDNVRNDEMRKLLDRKGSSLMSGGDNDMALTSIDMGYSCGLFKDLNLTHIIPKIRLTENYLLELSMYINISSILLNYIRFSKQDINSIVSLRPIINEIIKLITLKCFSFKPTIFELKRIRKIIKGNKRAVKIIGELHQHLNQVNLIK